jgi:hypothetical protein
MPGSVVLLWPLPFQQHLGHGIALLLPPVRANRIAAMVPDHGGRAVAQRPARLPQPPAHVDVVASGAKLWIESTDRLQVGLTERHVAARNMLGLLIG